MPYSFIAACRTLIDPPCLPALCSASPLAAASLAYALIGNVPWESLLELARIAYEAL